MINALNDVEKKIEFLYRVHDAPKSEKTHSLQEVLKGFSVSFPKGQRITPKFFNQTLTESKKTPYAALVNQLVLRTQTQARYSPENLGHFGLSLPRYCHFTSPIRRYADLTVHRSLIVALNLDQKSPSFEELQHNLEKTGTHLTQMEKAAVAAEREVCERYAALYHQNHSKKIFEGMITGVARFGCFVTLHETGAEGFIPVSHLGKNFYEFNEKSHSFHSPRDKKTFQLGDILKIRIREVDPLTNSLIFSPIEKS